MSAADYGILLMKRGSEEYTAVHLASTAVSMFMTNPNYCTVMGVIDGAALEINHKRISPCYGTLSATAHYLTRGTDIC